MHRKDLINWGLYYQKDLTLLRTKISGARKPRLKGSGAWPWSHCSEHQSWNPSWLPSLHLGPTVHSTVHGQESRNQKPGLAPGLQRFWLMVLAVLTSVGYLSVIPATFTEPLLCLPSKEKILGKKHRPSIGLFWQGFPEINSQLNRYSWENLSFQAFLGWEVGKGQHCSIWK